MSNEEIIKKKLVEAFACLDIALKEEDIVIERSKDAAHGDYASNAAMKFSRLAGMAPRALAEKLLPQLADESIEKIEIAGPGFLNFFMKQASLASIIAKVIGEGENYGKCPSKGKKVNVEYVSANPTGDLHLGHTRCAAVGDSIANILSFAGYDVTREYYVNDCGNQVEHLGHSIRARYHELFGEPLDLADDDYHGEDLIQIAKSIKEKYGDKYLKDSEESHDFFIRYGIDTELGKIKKDLDAFRVRFDVFSYESDIRKGGKVEKTLEWLREKGYVYVQDGATFLKTTAFLDDKDRPIVKSDGAYTYFMPDICYHYDKMSRGFDNLLDILGADHHGYINRMKSALMMKGYSKDVLEAEFVQVVRVYRDGVEVKMSKRTGKAIAHRDLVADVGVDAVRYFFVERSQSSHLDFNYNLAMEQSSNNPVYYAQYAHARCASILSLASDIDMDTSGSMLGSEPEKRLMKHIADFPVVVEAAAKSKEPSRIAGYIHSLAERFHEFYAACRVIDRENIPLTSSRLALIKAVEITMRNALNLLGVSAPEKM
ncbi:MAG: arginine--tRNA ligase [Bacilli bacterium]|nr:arginine--tRNA ligase [Bacilli bacterium]